MLFNWLDNLGDFLIVERQYLENEPRSVSRHATFRRRTAFLPAPMENIL
jgi:hypothetical protein